ncbi:MAG: esterase [Bacteroidia bacterium]|nr:esterase [Bacteroidia bacterium]
MKSSSTCNSPYLAANKVALAIVLFVLGIAITKETNAQERIIFESEYLKCNDTVLVFTPDHVSKETPLLFLLHGWSGAYHNWSAKTDIQEFSNKYGFIIVTPDGFYNSWYLNNIDTAKMQWRTFFDKELYPTIVSKYNSAPERTFITGLSMGGHGAINIFLDDTTRFKAAGSMSGVLNLQDTRLKSNQINEVLGEYSPENRLFDQNSAIYRLENFKGSKKMMLITCGAQDNLVQSSVDFTNKCSDLDIANTLILSPGVHSWDYWIYALDVHLFFFDKYLKD